MEVLVPEVSQFQQAEIEAISQLPDYADVLEEYSEFSPEIIVFDDLQRLFEQAADVVTETVHSYEIPIFSLPTGNTQGRFYDVLRARRADNPTRYDYSKTIVRGLDEYWDKDRRYAKAQSGSFYEYFKMNVYGGKGGLNVLPHYRFHPAINALDPFVEAAVHEKRQKILGPDSLTVLGLGRNGHIAFNEPGSPRYSRYRVVTITKDTRDANKGTECDPFRGDIANVPEYAITQGVGNLLESERAIVLVVGDHKAEALRRMIDEPVDAQTPSSWLRTHPKKQVTVFADRAAASKLP